MWHSDIGRSPIKNPSTHRKIRMINNIISRNTIQAKIKAVLSFITIILKNKLLNSYNVFFCFCLTIIAYCCVYWPFHWFFSFAPFSLFTNLICFVKSTTTSNFGRNFFSYTLILSWWDCLIIIHHS